MCAWGEGGVEREERVGRQREREREREIRVSVLVWCDLLVQVWTQGRHRPILRIRPASTPRKTLRANAILLRYCWHCGQHVRVNGGCCSLSIRVSLSLGSGLTLNRNIYIITGKWWTYRRHLVRAAPVPFQPQVHLQATLAGGCPYAKAVQMRGHA